jgi:hypothetical protein
MKSTPPGLHAAKDEGTYRTERTDKSVSEIFILRFAFSVLHFSLVFPLVFPAFALPNPPIASGQWFLKSVVSKIEN